MFLFLGVLAHEIGHIEKYHVSKRKTEIKNLKNINSYGNLVAASWLNDHSRTQYIECNCCKSNSCK